LDGIKKKNKKDKNQNYKQCPKCSIIIEKNEGCNQLTCTNCETSFCWLCEKKYTSDHYSIYNLRGCPGMRYAEPNKKSSILNNPCIKCLWYLLSCILCTLVICLIIIFYFFFGCAYEFIKCYLDQDENSKFEDEDHDEILDADEEYKRKQKVNKPLVWYNYIVILILAILGIALQPFYLLFYVMYAFMECYRRFGCWFFLATM
jgi:hypothetical protein